MPPMRCSASLGAGSSSSHARRIGRQARPDVVRRDAPIEDPAARLLVGDRFGQQVVQFEHLDAALPHLEHEVVVVLLSLVHPEHVVEQQIGAIARRQPLVGQARAADQDRSQRADFTMNTERCHDLLLESARDVVPAAQ